jgi:hypothetical protein
VVGVRGLERLIRPLGIALEVESDNAIDDRRGGTGTDDVERARLEEAVRVRGTGGWRPVDNGVLGLVGSPFVSGFASPTVHCRCNITDLVAHYNIC